jgi:hypothetical protein
MKVPLIISIPVVVFMALVVWYPLRIETATFVILTLTLIALGIYAWDTHSIATVAREQWKIQGVFDTAYEMAITDKKGESGRTVLRIHNSSKLIVRAKVRCNFRVYGSRVDYHPIYQGGETWYVFPQQISQGWFAIELLVQKKGKTIPQIIAERTEANKEMQLTMDLELEFRDELGKTRALPSRHHYFDFNDWIWIPQLTIKDEWL